MDPATLLQRACAGSPGFLITYHLNILQLGQITLIFFKIITWISDNCWGSSKWLLKSYLAFNAIHQWDWLLFKPPALHLSQWRSRRSHAWWWWRGGSLWRVGKGGRASVDESFCNRKRKFQNFTQAVGSFATQMVFYSLSFSSSRKPKTTEAIVLSIEL